MPLFRKSKGEAAAPQQPSSQPWENPYTADGNNRNSGSVFSNADSSSSNQGGGGSVVTTTTTTTTITTTGGENRSNTTYTNPPQEPEPELEPQRLSPQRTNGGRAIPERSPNRRPYPPVEQYPNAQPAPADYPPPPAFLRAPVNEPSPPLSEHSGHSGHSATSPTPTNFSRPGGKLAQMKNAATGLHGAGEAIRGAINGGIAKGLGEQDERERQRAIREEGMRDMERIGVQRTADGKIMAHGHNLGTDKSVRRRSGSHGLRNGPGLETVQERPTIERRPVGGI